MRGYPTRCAERSRRVGEAERNVVDDNSMIRGREVVPSVEILPLNLDGQPVGDFISSYPNYVRSSASRVAGGMYAAPGEFEARIP